MNSDFTLRQLEYFVAAADTGSISAAAERCTASQAAVSTALTDLERHLGMQLLIRQRAKGVGVTKGGARVLGAVRRLLADADELQAAADAEHTDVAGPIVVACTHALSQRVLPELAEQFAVRYPQLEPDLVDGLAAEIQDFVRDGKADACILYARQLQPGIAHREVAQVDPHVVVAADHPLAGHTGVALRQFAEEPLIIVDPRQSLNVIEAVIQEAGVSPRRRWSFANPETVLSMVARGLGYSVFSGRPAGHGWVDGRPVTYLPITDPVTPNKVVVGTAAGQRPTRRIEALTDLMASEQLQAVLS